MLLNECIHSSIQFKSKSKAKSRQAARNHTQEIDLQEFTAIYQEEVGEMLSRAEASEVAFCLVNLDMQLTKALLSEQKDVLKLMEVGHFQSQFRIL